MDYKLLSSVFYRNHNEYEKLYETRFNSESTYKFDFYIEDNQAFVLITPEILEKSVTIMKLDKVLHSKIKQVPHIAITQYINTCLVDEIKMTNDIEGVYSTRKEINDILNDKTEKRKRDRLYGLVKKYEMVLSDNLQLKNCEDIRRLYDELVYKEVVAADVTNKPDGRLFRADHVHVQNSYGRNIHNGIYPEEAIEQNMQQALNILNDDKYDFLIRIAVFHYMFGYIHPFYDGNGRTSRFISSYLLSKQLEVLIAYRISYIIKENVNSYYKSFKLINDPKNKGDLTSFVIRFFDILIQSFNELCATLDNKIEKLKYYKEIVNRIYPHNEDLSLYNLLYNLVQNSLFGEQGLSVEEISEIIKCGDSKTRTLLKILSEKNLLVVEKDKRKKIYSANLDTLSLI